MDVSVAEAKNRLTQLIRAVEEGETVVITRNGKPVAQLTPPPAARRQVRFGTMRGRIKTTPGWDKPLTLEQIPGGEFLEGYLLGTSIAFVAMDQPQRLRARVRAAIPSDAMKLTGVPADD